MSARATLALARAESGRVLRHPGLLVPLLLLAPVLYAMTGARSLRYPLLQEADQIAQPALVLLLGGPALVLSNLAVLRSRQHNMTALFDVLVLPQRWRTAVHLLAVVPFGLLAAMAVAVHIGYLAALPGAVGRPNPCELATGPAVVLLFGAVGVLLGRLVNTVVLGALALVVFAAVTLVTGVLAEPGSVQPDWLLPITVAAGGDPLLGPPSLPATLMNRPAGAHVLYVLGLTALVAIAALVSDRTRRPGVRSGRVTLAGVGCAALAFVVVAANAQAAGPSGAIVSARIDATDRPSSQESCRRIAQVTYCAFDGFQPWIGSWDEVVRGILRWVPAAVAAEPLAVRQRVFAYGYPKIVSGPLPPPPVNDWRADDQAAGTPDAITVGTWWGDGWSETSFAGRMAYELISRAGPGASGSVCGARGVLVGWLAAQATAGTRTGLQTMIGGSGPGGIQFQEAGFGSGLFLNSPELTMVQTLLQRPDDEIGTLAMKNWVELSALGTSTARAAQIFGLPAPADNQEETGCR